MFQFTPFQTYYAYDNFAGCFYDSSIAQNISLQPYMYYLQMPAEISENQVLQNAKQFVNWSGYKPLDDDQESIHNQNMTLIQEKIENKEKIQNLVENQSQDTSCKQKACKQKFGRNIVSNIFHLMIKFAQRQKRIRKMIERIIQKNCMIIKINQFYQVLKKKTGKMSAHATNQQMKDFWIGNTNNQNAKNNIKQKECSKIFRIVGKLYLEKYHIPYAYNSNKIKKESKPLHKSAIRKLYAL